LRSLRIERVARKEDNSREPAWFATSGAERREAQRIKVKEARRIDVKPTFQ
jgi:hypothetical protein